MTPDHRPVETEIKFRLTPTALAAIERHPIVSGSPVVSEQRQVTTYFDTPQLDLARQGISLRIRRNGERRMQTVKAIDARAVAARRGEWEQPVAGDAPDLEAAADTPAGPVLRAVAGAMLRPVFTTDIRRGSRVLRPDGDTVIEAAFDQGTITAETNSAPVFELELELKHGELGALYRLAIELAAAGGLVIEPAGKAERGFRLRSGKDPEAAKAADIEMTPDLTAEAAFGAIVRSGLSHVLANMQAAHLGDPEGVHQLRIAIRRLRAALLLFRPLLQHETTKRFGAELQRAGQVFGAARDWDVFVLDSVPAASADRTAPGWLELLREPAELRRAAALTRLRQELDGPTFTALLLGLAGWVEDASRHPLVAGNEQLLRPIAEIAPELIERVAHKVAKRGKGVGNAGHEALHDLRKAVKKLRYSVEFAAALYPRKPGQRLIKACKDLQELLGAANDAAVTPELAGQLAEARAELAPAVGELADWAAARGRKALRRVPKSWRKLRDAEGFWRQGRKFNAARSG
ncbi:MAG TPA: CHAD domain-containing protein [Acetobacteraceae bacterium]|nr:CHAD domain-containing protein [Acetobacteraceae bacterium]